MKQKYTITVADMELNIVSDASPDEVENLVGMLDRRMRDISLKSPRCTKNEAAVLCALSYCSERIAMQEAFKKVEKDAFRFAGENEKLKRIIENLEEDLENVKKDAQVMRSILDRAAVSAIAPLPTAEGEYVPKPFRKKEEEEKKSDAEQISLFETPAEDAPAADAAEEPTAEKEKKPTKNRVGTMFDLLTFSDI